MIEYISLGINIITLIVTIFLTVGIYIFESKHQKEQENLAEQLRYQSIEQSAKMFIIDNDEEIDYIVLAMIANKLQLKRKHHRSIITKFIRCSPEVQKEILKQLNIPDIDITDDDLSRYINCMIDYFKKNNLGKNYLNEGGKYFYKALHDYGNNKIDVENEMQFDVIEECNQNSRYFMPKGKYRFVDYLSDYMYLSNKDKYLAPLDYANMLFDLGTCEEQILTFWVMRTLIDGCMILRPKDYNVYNEDELEFSENLIKTQEDMFYYTVLVLYNNYSVA